MHRNTRNFVGVLLEMTPQPTFVVLGDYDVSSRKDRVSFCFREEKIVTHIVATTSINPL